LGWPIFSKIIRVFSRQGIWSWEITGKLWEIRGKIWKAMFFQKTSVFLGIFKKLVLTIPIKWVGLKPSPNGRFNSTWFPTLVPSQPQQRPVSEILLINFSFLGIFD